MHIPTEQSEYHPDGFFEYMTETKLKWTVPEKMTKIFL